MYNHLPGVDATRSLDGHRPASSGEVAELRLMHREHVAAERARMREAHPRVAAGVRRIRRPAAACWALVGTRR